MKIKITLFMLAMFLASNTVFAANSSDYEGIWCYQGQGASYPEKVEIRFNGSTPKIGYEGKKPVHTEMMYFDSEGVSDEDYPVFFTIRKKDVLDVASDVGLKEEKAYIKCGA